MKRSELIQVDGTKNVVEDKKLSFIEVVKKNMSINEVNLQV